MALFDMRWLYRFVKRHTNHIPEDKAYFWKRRLSLAYMVLSWNAFGFVIYQIYKGNKDWAKDYRTETERNLSPAQHFAKIMGVTDATVYRVSGLRVQKYEIQSQKGEENAEKENEAKTEQ